MDQVEKKTFAIFVCISVVNASVMLVGFCNTLFLLLHRAIEVSPYTVWEEIMVGLPADAKYALNCLKSSDCCLSFSLSF